MTGPTLTGSRVKLRNVEEGDLERLLEIILEPEVSQWWWDYDAARLRAEVLEDPDTTTLAIELLDGELIGLVMLSEESDPYYKSAGIDITLSTERLGQGLGSEVLRVVAEYLFAVRGHHRITIDPAAANERAIRAYRKVGFQPVGVMRAYELGPDGWHDNLLLDMLEGELT